VVRGDTVREVLSYVQFNSEELVSKLRKQVEVAVREKKITLEESTQLMRFTKRGCGGIRTWKNPRHSRVTSATLPMPLRERHGSQEQRRSHSFYEDFLREHRGWRHLEAVRTFLPLLFRERPMNGCKILHIHESLCITRYPYPEWFESRSFPLRQFKGVLLFEFRVEISQFGANGKERLFNHSG